MANAVCIFFYGIVRIVKQLTENVVTSRMKKFWFLKFQLQLAIAMGFWPDIHGTRLNF